MVYCHTNFLLKNSNTRSPIVATWREENESTKSSFDSITQSEGLVVRTNADGIVKATVQAIDLENLQEEIFDPVKKKHVKDLDWDRYYDNYVYMEIDNYFRKFQHRHVEQIEMAIRVLHDLGEPKSIPDEKITFKDCIFPELFRYYVRYFPWLHVYELEDKYNLRLDLAKNKAESKGDILGVADVIIDMLDRLKLDNDNWYKMPRSRDFPVGGVELLRYWKDKHMP
jgi:hypothetical protein